MARIDDAEADTFSKAYLVVIVITCYYWPLKGMPEAGEIRLIHFTPSFVSNFPVQVFAFTCAQNVSLPSLSVADYMLIGCSSPSYFLFIMRSRTTPKLE